MFRAAIENRGDSKFHATTRGYSFVLDTEGEGAHPIDTLLASLCGCLGHYVGDYLRDRQIGHSGFTIESEAGITHDKSRLSEINVRIDLKGVTLDEQQLSEFLGFVEKCKVHKILKVSPGVSISLASRSVPVEREKNSCRACA